ncbi:uncharacterized protein LOC141618279 [Silene latifolia]|uniref:uncharacterized protein LOC141618279 n=1 Tax=Silene latifolia TaxID=37657 RepID=UPI003D7712D1
MLSEFDLKYVPLKVVKGKAVADFLADNPVEEAEVVYTWSFLDEDVIHDENDEWDLYFDGASNYMGYGVRILLVSPEGGHIPVSIKYVHLLQDENQFADAPSKLAALINIPHNIDSMHICVERRSSPAYVNAIVDTEESETEPWYTTILKYKETEEYPPDLDARGNRALRMLSAQFVPTSDGQLYTKTSHDVLVGSFLRCIERMTVEKDMDEVHDGECGLQINAHVLVRKIMSLGYYWTTMDTDFRKTSIRKATWATPYSLVYGMEAVQPIELEMPSLRIVLESQVPEADWVQARYDSLVLLDECRLNTLYHVQLYQKRIERAFKQKVKPRGINEGDLVLKSARALLPIDPRGKFKPNWA